MCCSPHCRKLFYNQSSKDWIEILFKKWLDQLIDLLIFFCLTWQGAQSQNAPDAVKKIHDKVEAAIVAVSDQIQYILDGAKEKANEVGLELKNSAEKIAQEMHEEVKKYMAEVNKKIFLTFLSTENVNENVIHLQRKGK